jgi:hypothetical protein
MLRYGRLDYRASITKRNVIYCSDVSGMLSASGFAAMWTFSAQAFTLKHNDHRTVLFNTLILYLIGICIFYTKKDLHYFFERKCRITTFSTNFALCRCHTIHSNLFV